jgi:hypothetical protein
MRRRASFALREALDCDPAPWSMCGMLFSGKHIIVGAFVPVCLAGLIVFDSRDRDVCPVPLAIERGRDKLRAAPDVIDVEDTELEWLADCRFRMTAMVATLKGSSGNLRQEQVDLSFDFANGRWQAAKTN